jgi:hypothetical protein
MLKIQNITSDGPTQDVLRLRGVATVDVSGIWDGAEIQLQVTFDGGATWKNVPDAVLEETRSFFGIEIGICFLRGVVSNAGGSTNLTLTLFPYSAS